MSSERPDEILPVDAKQAFFSRVVSDLTSNLSIETLRSQARDLRLSLEKNLSDVESISMLPSFVDDAPTGEEEGQALTVDIGGSNMRVALVNLVPQASNLDERLAVKCQRRWPIGPDIKLLQEVEFFDWVAGNISSFLAEAKTEIYIQSGELPTGLVWSFPLDQTRLDDGILRSMGKGFKFGSQLEGRSLKACLEQAFEDHGLHLRLDAIMNDCISVVLGLAYTHPSVKIGVVVGTGFNGALSLATSALAPEKYGRRSPTWATSRPKVLVDAELCVTGQEIFPRTKWDQRISAMLPRPDALGLELLVGGFYMGETIRQIIIDGVKQAGLFRGKLPGGIETPFSWTMKNAALLELWKAGGTEHVRRRILDTFGTEIDATDEDLTYLQKTCRALLTRAAAYVAVAVCSMRDLQDSKTSPRTEPPGNVVNGLNSRPTELVSCVGSVLEKYPGFLETTQAYLNEVLMEGSDSHKANPQAAIPNVQLKVLPSSSLTGVAVAVLQAHLRDRSPAASLSNIAAVTIGDSYSSLKPGEDVSIEIHQTSRQLCNVSTQNKQSRSWFCTGLLSELFSRLGGRRNC